MDPPPRSFATEADDCFMVWVLRPNRIQACGAFDRTQWRAPLGLQPVHGPGHMLRQGMSGPASPKDGTVLPAVNAAFRAAFGGGLTASVDSLCARRRSECRPGRRNAAQPNRETCRRSCGHNQQDIQDGKTRKEKQGRKNRAVPLTKDAPYKPVAGNPPDRFDEGEVETEATAGLLRHRQTKGAANS
jgi:hypothetical protein